MIKLNVVEFFISLLDKLGNLILVHRKDKPVFEIDSWTTDPIHKTVVVSIDNIKEVFFIITKIETEDNLICTERLPKNVNVGNITSLQFYYKGNYEIPSKDKFCISMYYKNIISCKYKCKLIYRNDKFWIEY